MKERTQLKDVEKVKLYNWLTEHRIQLEQKARVDIAVMATEQLGFRVGRSAIRTFTTQLEWEPNARQLGQAEKKPRDALRSELAAAKAEVESLKAEVESLRSKLNSILEAIKS